MIQLRQGIFETNSSSGNVFVVPLEYYIPSEVILGYDDEDELSRWYNGLKSNHKEQIEPFFCWLRDCGVKKIYIRDKYVDSEVKMNELPKDKGEVPTVYWLNENNRISKYAPSSQEELVKAYFFGDCHFILNSSDEQTITRVKSYRESPRYAVYEIGF